ncbi:hypothetical protein V6N11_057080 [Hibiscus sabdariffa]|uniref:Uncharacterized protein n=1 Tax=Hibiscus sabdariffa TaxID=183260 RepID=A0ABR1ZW54_9ROSI
MPLRLPPGFPYVDPHPSESTQIFFTLNVAKLPLLPPRSQFWSGLPPLLKGLTSRSSAGNEDYVKGVVGLAKGLREVKSKYPLVMAVLSVVARRDSAGSRGA